MPVPFLYEVRPDVATCVSSDKQELGEYLLLEHLMSYVFYFLSSTHKSLLK